MDKPAHEPAILQGQRRVRYLKLIALFKIAKGGTRPDPWCFTPFSQRADTLDGRPVELDC